MDQLFNRFVDAWSGRAESRCPQLALISISVKTKENRTAATDDDDDIVMLCSGW